MKGIRLDIEGDIRRINRRTAREDRTPRVVYSNGSHYGVARLASIRDYLGLRGWPPDYSQARVITNPDDLEAIKQAEVAIRAARKAADHVYARAFTRGDAIDPSAAERAAKLVE